MGEGEVQVHYPGLVFQEGGVKRAEAAPEERIGANQMHRVAPDGESSVAPDRFRGEGFGKLGNQCIGGQENETRHKQNTEAGQRDIGLAARQPRAQRHRRHHEQGGQCGRETHPR